MAGSNNKAKSSNLKKIPGHPGLYTFVTVTRDPKKDKALLKKVIRDAARLRADRLANEFRF